MANFRQPLTSSLLALLVLISLTVANIGFCEGEASLPIIGITEIRAPVDDPYLFNRVNTKAGSFQVMLETQLSQIGRFKIIERNRIDEILGEQGLNNTFGDGQTAGRGFHVEGVDYLVYGAVTKFGQKKKSITTGSFTNIQLITEFGADIKVVDASTGEVRAAEVADVVMVTAEGVATGNFENSTGTADPLSEVQRLAAKKVAAIIATGIFPIEVVKGGDIIYLNYGESILNTGDILKAFRKGETLIDEATGINLGSEEEEIGTIKVFEVTQKFSKAKLESGTSPGKGDLLRIISSAKEAKSDSNPGEKRGRKI